MVSCLPWCTGRVFKYCYTITKISSFWQNFHYWLRRWSQWWKFHENFNFSVSVYLTIPHNLSHEVWAYLIYSKLDLRFTAIICDCSVLQNIVLFRWSYNGTSFQYNIQTFQTMIFTLFIGWHNSFMLWPRACLWLDELKPAPAKSTFIWQVKTKTYMHSWAFRHAIRSTSLLRWCEG